MSNPEFDESKIAEYRLQHQEIRILMSIAVRSNKIGDKDKAIYITEALINNRENLRTSEDDKASFLPALLFNLSNYLGQAGKIRESLQACDKGLEICREYNRFDLTPVLLHNKATNQRMLGEEERMYRTHLIRAYHSANAMGQFDVAEEVKKDAEESFGINIMKFWD
ncbi:MAG: hypothetical protein FWE21_02755 [Defluviitaleaceae bacterium]|nr:hypothetical protein [Defluviitaleaceae bacterium]